MPPPPAVGRTPAMAPGVGCPVPAATTAADTPPVCCWQAAVATRGRAGMARCQAAAPEVSAVAPLAPSGGVGHG